LYLEEAQNERCIDKYSLAIPRTKGF